MTDLKKTHIRKQRIGREENEKKGCKREWETKTQYNYLGGGARAEKDSIAEIAAYVSGMRRK